MQRNTDRNATSSTPAPTSVSGIVLVVGVGLGGSRPLERQLRASGVVCEFADTDTVARDRMTEKNYEIVVLLAESGVRWLEFVRELAGADAGPVVIAASERPTIEQAVEAMRAGAVDLVGMDITPDNLRDRLRDAFARAASRRSAASKSRRLERACEELSSARSDIAGQVGSLCEDLVCAYSELTDRVELIAALSEYACEVKSELDIEGLLRTTLEFLLSRTGPTNGAIYLPGASGDYTLGAFVNLDMPRDSAEVVFDHLADFAPEFAETLDRPVTLADPADLEDAFGPEAGWLPGRAALVAGCEHEGENLAAIVLFRDEQETFDESTRELLGVICARFAEQLAKVINIHHRHMPEGAWGFFDEPEEDGGFGLAA